MSESPQVRKQDISYKGNVRKPYRDEKIAIDKATTLNGELANFLIIDV